MRFLGNVLSTVLGLFIFFAILFFGLLVIGIAMGSGSDKPVVKTNSILELDLSKVTYDYGGKFNFKEFNFKDVDNSGVVDVLDAIEFAKTDDRIKGISILHNASALGITQKQEIRQKLEEFKASGKFVLSYANTYTQSEYYMNSVADTIYLNPVGGLDFRGLSTEILYLKGLQEKTGIKMEVIRHGKYKSAVEPYLEDKMSAANHEQTLVFLESIWNSVAQDIATSRNIAVDSLNNIASNLLANTPKKALEVGLIDKVVYEDEYHNGIRYALNVEKEKDYNTISVLSYIKDVVAKNNATTNNNQIALIFAQGQILNGEGNVSYIGEKSINRALKKARDNDKIKAIVLRVNSPGGSALTSDLIWREIEITKKTKPVIVSMGDLAASGGYYISANADRIFAEPTTITGSIGVFGMLPNFSTLTTKYGVNAEQVSTHKNAAFYSPFKPLAESTRAEITEGIEEVYKTFVQRVMDGRNMTFEQVDHIAQGRVWTGADALKNGLIDEIGGMEDAIQYAATKVELDSYKIIKFPEYELTFDDLLRNYLGASIIKTQDELIKEKIGQENFELFERLNYFKGLEGAQTILPFTLDIK